MSDTTGAPDVARRRRWPTVLALVLAVFLGNAVGSGWAWSQVLAEVPAAIDSAVPDVPDIDVQPALDRGAQAVDDLLRFVPGGAR